MSSKANQAKNKGILGIVFTLYLVNEVTQMLSKIELATFEEKEPRIWLRKYVKYFEIYKVPNEQRVLLASLF